ncbi:AfsR/SARP family transcriptional regulator [Streptomyces sp. NRRL B-1347]|uniref:AfsR/SARP family transcriptional regulator n=1 Tax=Streptomyces sp. NRRL B-1347 TaxID=1476877 RepID=UPI0004C579A3|nr:AfsR/SARP family transcriptional regulator [Streptomyces sp. NRRL B-1347]
MDFRVLGPVEAMRGAERIALTGSKVPTVLAALLLARGRVVSDARMSTLLWGWEPPATSGAQIYTYMSRLRKLLGDEVAIERRPPGYALRAPRSTVDLIEFERLAERGRAELAAGRNREASALLGQALGLWRGTGVSGVTDHLAEAELPRLEEARMHVLERRIEADLALGRHERLTAELTGLVAEYPLREKLRAQLMTALYRCGRQAEALRSYHEGRDVLADQLGIDPGETLGSTYHAVLVGKLGSGPGAGGGAPAADTHDDAPRPSMLPADVEELIGRESELASMQKQLTPDPDGGGPRGLLVTGMAGVGKTALAVRAAHAAARHYPDGQLFAELTTADGTPRSVRDVLTMLLRALGEVPDLGDSAGGLGGADGSYDERTCLDELIRLYRIRTAGKRLLVVLDGAVDSGQLEPLVPGSPEATVLITSRARLPRVTQARTTVLTPLDDGAALDLLVSVAGRAQLLADPAATQALLARCGGLPLALRVVGSRLAARPRWPAAWLANRLADPSTRLRELSYGGLDVRGALLTSLRQLPRHTGRTLMCLAALGTEPFRAETAARCLAEPESTAEQRLERLVDAALLDICGVDRLGRPLYRFHELVVLFSQSLGRARAEPART